MFRDDTSEIIPFGLKNYSYIRTGYRLLFRRHCLLRWCEFEMHEENSCVSTGLTKTKQITAWGFEVQTFDPMEKLSPPSEHSQKGFGSLGFRHLTAKSHKSHNSLTLNCFL